MNGDTPTATQKAVNAVMLWKLAIFELVVMCAITAGTFYQSWMGGDTEWSDLSAGRRMMFKVGVSLQVLLVIKSFLSKTVSNVSKGINMPGSLDGADNGGSQRWTRSQKDTMEIKQTGPSSGAPEPPPLAAAPIMPPNPPGMK